MSNEKLELKYISKIIEHAIEATIGNKEYDGQSVNQWVTQIVEKSLDKMKENYPNFKHIVTCVIMDKNGSGLHCSSSVFWDNSLDDCGVIRWENKFMNAIVSVFSLSI